jgi:hypothetical protein
MSVTGTVGIGTAQINAILGMQSQLNELQRQLGTGQKSNTYAGLGLNAGLSVALRSQQSAVQSYQDTSTMVGTRLSIAQSALTQIDGAASTVKSAAANTSAIFTATGQTIDQITAQGQLGQIIDALNVQVGNQYIFSGKSPNVTPVASSDQILNGSNGQAGLIQLMAERKQADLGSNGLGRLTIPAAVSAPASLVGTGAALAPAAASGTQSLATPYTSAGGTLVINGTTVNIPAGADSTAVLAAINAPGVVSATGVTASLDSSNRLVLTGPDAATPVTVGAGSTLLGETGLSAVTTNPPDLLSQTPPVATAGQTLTVTIGSNPPLTITFGTNTAAVPPEVSTVAQLNAQLGTLVGAGAATAAVDPATGNITLTGTNLNDTISVTGSADASKFGLSSTVAAPNSVSIGEDAAGSPFGFKLASYSSSLTGATVATSGSPSKYTVNFSSNPNAGEAVTFNFNLPDGTTSAVTLTATTDNPPAAGQFTIGANPAATASNFQTALTGAVTTQAATSLTAASAMAAANNFFNIDDTHPPMRVNGPPFDSATSLIAGTSANTVRWYNGEDDGSSARDTAAARVDTSISVSYGMRADEQAMRTALANTAVFAAMKFSSSDPNTGAAYTQLTQRVVSNLGAPTGTQKITDVEAEIANAQVVMKGSTDRQTQTQSTISDMLDSVAGVSTEQVGAEILAMQTRLQASLQTTALLSKISLVNYLS